MSIFCLLFNSPIFELQSENRELSARAAAVHRAEHLTAKSRLGAPGPVPAFAQLGLARSGARRIEINQQRLAIGVARASVTVDED